MQPGVAVKARPLPLTTGRWQKTQTKESANYVSVRRFNSRDDTFVWRYMALDRPIVQEFLANKDRNFVYEDLPLADLDAWSDGFVMLE